MAKHDPRGVLYETFDGKEYRLHLGMRGYARLQALHGNNIAGLTDGTAGDNPPFEPVLDIVSYALRRGEKMEADDADDLAEEMLTDDISLVFRVMQAIFPDATLEQGGKGKPKKMKAVT